MNNAAPLPSSCHFLILQEEDLFKWERTDYPEVEAITKAIEPYQKLFSVVVKWQKAEKKWMDGAFLELNAESTEAEVFFCKNLMNLI